MVWMDASLHDTDVMPFLVSSGFLCTVSTVSDTSKLHLTHTVKSHNLWCQIRAVLLPVLQAGRMSASKVIHYFSGHSATFGVQASLLPDNLTLIPANKRVYQTISDFQTGLGVAAHAT